MVHSHVEDQTETMADNLSYLEDAAELRRTLVPPPALFIRPPLGHAEGALEKEIRAREQKIVDENHKLEVSRHNEYKNKLSSDYPKATTAHYYFLSRQIITDLERHIENISPPTTDAGAHYRAISTNRGPARTSTHSRQSRTSRTSPKTTEDGTSTFPV
jgi:hypothetical protein